MNNLETELIIIGAWLEGEHLEDKKMFKPDDFEHFNQLGKLYMEGITDRVELSIQTKIPLAEINKIPMNYVEATYESAMQRVAREKAIEWINDHQNASPMEIAEAMRQFEITSTNLPKPSEDPVLAFQDELDRRRTMPFVGTGITALDLMLNGIRRKELTSVGARPSVGKSAFCQQVGMEVAKHGNKVLFFPLEMDELALSERMFMRYTDIPQSSVRRGLTDEQWKDPRTAEAFDRMDEIYTSGNFLVFPRVNDLKIIGQLVRVYKPYMIIIDQLEQLKDGRHSWKDKRSRFSHMTHELQGMAMDEDIAIWLACQVNRSADDSPPTLANLKESGSIEEDSDNVILLHREEVLQNGNQKILLNLSKQRAGETGEIPIGFVPKDYRFCGLESRI